MSKLYNNLAWNNVKWSLVRKRVSRMQHRIFKAKRNGLTKLVIGLQRKLIKSLDAKLLSVLHVTTYNKGRKTAGVDRQIITSSQTKLKLAINLKLDGKAKPIRRVWIPKPGKAEKRPLGIPTILDRAKQYLANLALEPEWEAVFEPNSFGFRKGRSSHDAIESIFKYLRHNRTKYVIDADIRKCFDRINHKALLSKLNTFPSMERQVSAWLKACIMEGYANTPKEYGLVTENLMGTPQGGIISPLLANIALHGLEMHLKDFCGKMDPKIYNTKARGYQRRAEACGVIRYADDFVVIHENKRVLELCLDEINMWLNNMGLEINLDKTKLIDARQGFKFLGFQIILVKRGTQVNQPYKVKIIPSKLNCLSFLNKVRIIIRKAKAMSSYNLIELLRPVYIGWANYFRTSECKKVFQKLDYMIYGMLRAWAFRRDTRSGRFVIRQKYFPKDCTYIFHGRTYKDNWILAGKSKATNGIIKKNFLPRLHWIESTQHIKIIGNKSPYDGDYIYWAKRLAKYSGLSNTMVKMMKNQNYKCNICGSNFVLGERLEIDHIVPRSLGGSNKYDNLQLVHRICHVGKTRDENAPLIYVPDSKLLKDEQQLFFEYSVDEINGTESF